MPNPQIGLDMFEYASSLVVDDPLRPAVCMVADQVVRPGPDAPLWNVPPAAVGFSRAIALGRVAGREVNALRLGVCPPGWISQSLRAVLFNADPVQFQVLSAAAQLLDWIEAQTYCSHCGIRMNPLPDDRGLRCVQCDLRSYPHIHPCIIVSIWRPGEVLLAQSRRMQHTGMFSCIAGFLEAGESAEAAVHREVREETGLEVTDLHYVTSQTWPFPRQLMLGFVARLAGGTLQADQSELVALDWYRPSALPLLAPPPTIARTLIDHCLARCMT